MVSGEPSVPTGSRKDSLGGLREVGAGAGTARFVHYPLSSLGWVDGVEHAVSDALLGAAGETGLLAMPTLSWDTANVAQLVFHECPAPSSVAESFRHRASVHGGVRRTRSVGASGREAAEFVADHDGYGRLCAAGPPHGKLVGGDGSVLLHGVSLETCTLLHAFEEWSGRSLAVRWRGATVVHLWGQRRLPRTSELGSSRCGAGTLGGSRSSGATEARRLYKGKLMADRTNDGV